MTRNEFANTKFYHGQKVKYKGGIYNINSVDFAEDLIAIDMINDCMSDDELIQWVRCENCEIYSERPQRPSNPSTQPV